MSAEFDDDRVERLVLSYAINNPMVFKPLDPELYAYAINRKVQEALNNFYKETGLAPTLASMLEYCKDYDVVFFLKDIATKVVDAATHRVGIDKLFELYQNRTILNEAKVLAESLSGASVNPQELIHSTLSRFSGLRHPLHAGVVKRGFVHEVARDFWSDFKRREKNPEQFLTRSSFGIAGFDLVTNGGIDPTELCLIYGDTNSGKTTLMSNIAYNMSVLGKHVLYVSIEMDYTTIFRSWVSRAALLDSRRVEVSRLTAEERPKLRSTLQLIEQMRDLPYLVYWPGEATSADIRREILAYRGKFGHNLDAVFIDYAGIMYPVHEWSGTSERFDNLFIELKSIAGEEHVSVITALMESRTSKQKKKEEEHSIDDIGRSHFVAPHCDFVFYIKQEKIDDASGVLNVYVQKGRKGLKGKKLPLTAIWNKSFVGDMNLMLPHQRVRPAIENMIQKLIMKPDVLGISETAQSENVVDSGDIQTVPQTDLPPTSLLDSEDVQGEHAV